LLRGNIKAGDRVEVTAVAEGKLAFHVAEPSTTAAPAG